MVLRACIDASRSNAGVYSVACVSFGPERLSKANRLWKDTLGDRTFHMTDLHGRRGEFSGITHQEADTIMRSVVSIVKLYASHISVISMDLGSFSGQLPRPSNNKKSTLEIFEKAFRSPYGSMIHLLMYQMGRFAKFKNNNKLQISYYIESGDIGQKSFMEYLQYVKSDERFKYFKLKYSMSDVYISNKNNMHPAFHSADLIAWEWGRHILRHSEGRAIRPSLSELTKTGHSYSDEIGLTLTDGRTHFFRHFNNQVRDRYYKFLLDTSEATSDEELDAATRIWDSSR